jgi:hypothetical protein
MEIPEHEFRDSWELLQHFVERLAFTLFEQREAIELIREWFCPRSSVQNR